MHQLVAAAPSVLAAFMASLVEFVEALTIVLAVGIVRGWRSALMGTGAALALLLALVAVLGPALARIPLGVVQLVVGTLLLLFGLRWLRKAVLRAAGVLALHDEAKAFDEETALLRSQGGAPRRGIDGVAFSASFKIVMLEGIEVVFIVIAVGAGGTMLVPAGVGAALALLTVVALGLWLHRPLAQVPENTLKFCVGVLLSAFGCFWVGEGVGLAWPASDAALLALVALFLLVALGSVRVCRQLRRVAAQRPARKTTAGSPAAPAGWRLVLDEAIALFVDDGWLAAGIVAWVALAWFFGGAAVLQPAPRAAVFSLGLGALLATSAARRAAT
jgi:uncharacterized membrane protein